MKTSLKDTLAKTTQPRLNQLSRRKKAKKLKQGYTISAHVGGSARPTPTDDYTIGT